MSRFCFKIFGILIYVTAFSACSPALNKPSSGAYEAANKSLLSNGYEDCKATGKTYQEADHELGTINEIIYKCGKYTLEVDVSSTSNTVVELELDITLSDIPSEVIDAVKEVDQGLVLKDCSHYQRSLHVATGEEFYELEECNDGKHDYEVNLRTLDVVADIDDHTERSDHSRTVE